MSGNTTREHCVTCGKDCHSNFRICPNCGSLLNTSKTIAPSNVTYAAGQVLAAGPFIGQSTATERDWSEAPTAPWRRWAARSLDITINGTIMVTFAGIALFALVPYEADLFFVFLESPSGILINFILATLMGCVLTGLIIGSTGSSVGKYFFGVRVTTHNGLPIGAMAGMVRDLEVWVKGLGLGIPIVVLFTQIYSYIGLTKSGISSWDVGKNKVTYRANGKKQYILNTLGIFLWIIVVSILSAMRML